MKIVVVGLGYVGLSNAVLLAQHNDVIGIDLSEDRVDLLNAGKSPILDKDLSEYLSKASLKFKASIDLKSSIIGADYVIVSTPTNYDENKNIFDTKSVETVIAQVVKLEPSACIVIKSTIPVGFVDSVRKQFNSDAIIFSPEFLREGSALHDNLYPSRIVVGEKSARAKVFAGLLKQGACKKEIKVIFTGAKEAEAIKLFANTYLAMRVAFFNELDSYVLAENMEGREIIEGVCLDPRISSQYNNPSFGYGGYCLPKDTKQLLANYKAIPQNLISAIVDANVTRKNYLTEHILSKKPKVVGIFRLVMKTGSDNFRESAIQGIMDRLNEKGVKVIVYEPSYAGASYFSYSIQNDLSKFKMISDIIIANRFGSDLEDVRDKVFTRDIFGSD